MAPNSAKLPMSSEPTNAARSALGLGVLAIVVNITLVLLKIGVGLLGNSYALIADGIESVSDILTSLITWAGFQLSLKPADDDHPFGHGRAESLAGLFSGISLLAAAGVIAYHSIKEILTPHHAPAWFTLPVLIATIVVKEALSRKVNAAASEFGSTALQGDAWHHRADALTSGAAAVGIIIALIGGSGYEPADDWAALVGCSIIVVNGSKILRGALHEVLDGHVGSELHASVEAAALSTPGVENTEKCRIRKSGTQLFVEIHVRVDPQMTVVESHRISHEVKDRMIEKHPRILDVVVHIEPAHPRSR